MNAEQRLYAVVLRMATTRRGAIPADHGKVVLSALYHLIDRGDQALAQTLHDANLHKPFTVGLIQGGKRDHRHAQHFGEGDPAEWRFTLLRDPAFEALIQRYISDRDLPHVRIGAVEFQITDAFVSGSHAHSGSLSLETLAARYQQPPENYFGAVKLDFLSPTVFNLGTDRESRQRRLRALPIPRTLFSSLRKRWAQLGGAGPGDAFDTWIEQAIEAEPLSLRWQHVHIEKMWVRGFLGQVRFQHWGPDRRWLPFLHLLADLAFYTGVGYQTTRGLGQVRRAADDEVPDAD
ncbi:MAG: CRISPR system precrRNA processing endoribonuclease RAMP protein Cas6 [Chloroflexi bacterium]|nr:CRISPR system precrRNA processing endoribonuclease RAMP protein Cas6 [Chloroflexota bacterium]